MAAETPSTVASPGITWCATSARGAHRVARLPAALREWEADGGDYVGCPFIGGEMFDRPRHRFFEPLGFVFAKREYYLFFSGGARRGCRWC